MKKVIIFLIIVFCLTGCTSSYNIKISNDKINESVVSVINGSELSAPYMQYYNSNYSPDDPLTPFIKNEQYPFVNNFNDIYEKDVKEEYDNYIVTLKYDYTYDEYKKSKAYNCFENRRFDSEDGLYTIEMGGHFYCLYGDEVKINIETNNKVIKNNADSVNGNIYTWIINNSNLNNKSIILSFKGRKKLLNLNDPMTRFAFSLIALVAIGFIIYVFVRNRFRKNNSL